METSTKIIVETSNFDGQKDTITVERNYSDVSMEDLFEMFRCIALAMGYHSDTVSQYFEPDFNIEETIEGDE